MPGHAMAMAMAHGHGHGRPRLKPMVPPPKKEEETKTLSPPTDPKPLATLPFSIRLRRFPVRGAFARLSPPSSNYVGMYGDYLWCVIFSGVQRSSIHIRSQRLKCHMLRVIYGVYNVSHMTKGSDRADDAAHSEVSDKQL